MSKTILVTGANRGIGLCIVQGLAQRDQSATILVASRVHATAEEAIARLRELGIRADFHAVELDVSKDDSIHTAVKDVTQKFGKIDVLINNAGIAAVPKDDLSDFRSVYQSIFNTNITSVGLVSSLFLPLLQQSTNPRIVNISSGRGSIHNLTTGNLPPTASVPYSISKTALNVLTLEMAKAYPDVAFYAANPGHCKTALNGYRGKRDPLEGAQVAVELALAEKGAYELGFWEFVEGRMKEMPW